MDKKFLNELKPAIRGLGQDYKHLKGAYDALRALASLKTEGSNEVVTLAHNQLVQALWSMSRRINDIEATIASDLALDTDVEQEAESTHGEAISSFEVSPDGNA